MYLKKTTKEIQKELTIILGKFRFVSALNFKKFFEK